MVSPLGTILQTEKVLRITVLKCRFLGNKARLNSKKRPRSGRICVSSTQAPPSPPPPPPATPKAWPGGPQWLSRVHLAVKLQKPLALWMWFLNWILCCVEVGSVGKWKVRFWASRDPGLLSSLTLWFFIGFHRITVLEQSFIVAILSLLEAVSFFKNLIQSSWHFLPAWGKSCIHINLHAIARVGEALIAFWSNMLELLPCMSSFSSWGTCYLWMQPPDGDRK